MVLTCGWSLWGVSPKGLDDLASIRPLPAWGGQVTSCFLNDWHCSFDCSFTTFCKLSLSYILIFEILLYLFLTQTSSSYRVNIFHTCKKYSLLFMSMSILQHHEGLLLWRLPWLLLLGLQEAGASEVRQDHRNQDPVNTPNEPVITEINSRFTFVCCDGCKAGFTDVNNMIFYTILYILCYSMG